MRFISFICDESIDNMDDTVAKVKKKGKKKLVVKGIAPGETIITVFDKDELIIGEWVIKVE